MARRTKKAVAARVRRLRVKRVGCLRRHTKQGWTKREAKDLCGPRGAWFKRQYREMGYGP